MKLIIGTSLKPQVLIITYLKTSIGGLLDINLRIRAKHRSSATISISTSEKKNPISPLILSGSLSESLNLGEGIERCKACAKDYIRLLLCSPPVSDYISLRTLLINPVIRSLSISPSTVRGLPMQGLVRLHGLPPIQAQHRKP